MSKKAVRILKELHELRQSLPPYILAAPSPDNFHTIFFVFVRMPVMDGEQYADAKPFEKGVYMFVLNIGGDWPHSPPTLRSLTPNGRFMVGETLCMDGTHYHKNRHNAAMSLASFIISVSLFMQTNEPGVGGLYQSAKKREKHAAKSMEYNLGNEMFRELFADQINGTHKKRPREEVPEVVEEAAPDEASSSVPDAPASPHRSPPDTTPPKPIPWAFELTRTTVSPIVSTPLTPSENEILFMISTAGTTPSDEFIRSAQNVSDDYFMDIWRSGEFVLRTRKNLLKMWDKYVVPKVPATAPPLVYAGSRPHLPHQQEVFPILVHLDKTPVVNKNGVPRRAGGALCDAPGLGKTSQIGAVLATNRIEGVTLIVAKNSLQGHWKKELMMHGISSGELLFCNPRAAGDLPESTMRTIGRVVLDECHENINRTFIQKLEKMLNVTVWIVTGTPNRRTIEVFNDLIGKFSSEFIHCDVKSIGADVPPLWFDRAVVRSSEFVPISLPSLTETNVHVHMTGLERKNYLIVENHFFQLLLNDLDFDGRGWNRVRPLFRQLLVSIFAGNFDVLKARMAEMHVVRADEPSFDRLVVNELPSKADCERRLVQIEREKTCPVCLNELYADTSVFFWKCGHVQCKDCFNHITKNDSPRCGLPCERSGLSDCYQVSLIRSLCDAPEEKLPPEEKPPIETINVLKNVPAEETPKGSYIVDLVEKAKRAGEHVAIVTHTVGVIRALKRVFKGCAALSEGTNQKMVEEILADVADQKIDVLLVLIPRYATGVNLQNFDHVVICEPLESMDAERQVISRFMRMGSVRPTLVHRLICRGTVDGYVFRAHQEGIKITGQSVFRAIGARHH